MRQVVRGKDRPGPLDLSGSTRTYPSVDSIRELIRDAWKLKYEPRALSPAFRKALKFRQFYWCFMGRTRSRKKASKTIDPPVQQTGNPPSITSLLEKAQSLIVQCDYELALRFIRRILSQESTNVEAKEMLGVVQLETGELEAAKEVGRDRNP